MYSSNKMTLKDQLWLAIDEYQEISNNLDDLRDLIIDKDLEKLVELYEEIKKGDWFREVFIDTGLDEEIEDFILENKE